MRTLDKSKRSRLITNIYIMVSMFVMLSGYNLVFNKPTTVNAMYTIDSYTNGISQVSGSNGLQNVFMRYDGSVWGSGYNVDGQLGLGNCTSRQSLAQIPITNIENIECSSLNTYFGKWDGTVWGCGDNSYGQLGIGNTTDQYTPVQISITKVKAIKSSNGHTIFIKYDGTVWGCGDNSYGQLGIGSTAKQSTIVQIPITNVDRVYCVGDSTMFIKYDGTVWGCGLNSQGQLGIGSFSNTLSPIQIPINNVKDIDGGWQHTIFLKYDGTVWGCGDNSLKELGVTGVTSSSSIIQIPINSVDDIECTTYSTMFLKKDGTLWGCGDNSDGELGIGTTEKKVSLMQIPITNVSRIGQSLRTTYVIKNDDSIWGCGYNSSGSLGIDDYQDKCIFVNLSGYWVTTDDRATNTVVKAEISKLQSDFDVALKVVDALPSSKIKTDLSNRLIAMQPYTDVALAIKAVVDAEEYQCQLDLEQAEDLVHSLPNSACKTDLINRLEVVEHNIYLNKIKSVADVVSEAEANKDKLELRDLYDLWNKVDNLPGLPEKKVVMDRMIALDYAVKLAKATAYVRSAELYPDQSDLWNAQSVLEIMTNTPEKAALLDRIAVVQARLNINGVTNLVISAEETKRQVDINIAKREVEALPDSIDKTELLKRLAAVQNTIDVLYGLIGMNNELKAVTYAEATKEQVDLGNAKVLVDALTDSTYKTDLLNRLAVVQNQININNAAAKVTYAERTREPSDLSNAKAVVDSLPNSTAKNDLVNRLKVVETYINKLADATAKTRTAEYEKANIEPAQSAINLLPIGDTKRIQLQNRLDVVKLYIATTAVINAETTKKQVDVGKAKVLTDILPTSKYKTDLLNRLVVIQNTIGVPNVINVAINAVTNAETSKKQVDVDSAKVLVTKLPDSTDKTNLLNRLSVVQKTIDLTNAITSVTNAETTKKQVDVDNAKVLVNKLSDSTAKTDLSNRLNVVQTYIRNIIDATTLVVRAEVSKRQLDVIRATSLLDTLANSIGKTNLLNRLNVVQDVIDLNNVINIVVKAETSKQQVDVNRAITSVNSLSASTDKTSLLSRLAVVQNSINLTYATNAVVKAETSKKQIDVSIAANLVNVLPTSTNKTNLSNRLINVQNTINSRINLADATNAVVKAETSRKQLDVSIATSLINVLPTSTDKTNLSNRLINVQNIINSGTNLTNATNAVVKAETSRKQLDVSIATSLINVLPTSTDKTNLSNRLINVQNIINSGTNLTNATNEVVKAETSKKQIDVSIATSLVNALPASTNKTNLSNRLINVQNTINSGINLVNAINAVVKAETSKKQIDVSIATSLVNALPASTNKTNLSNRLINVQNTINSGINLANAINAVIKAETSKKQIDVSIATTLVNALPDSKDKTSLSKRLEDLQSEINNPLYLMEATDAVTIAEEVKTQLNVDKAAKLVNNLRDSMGKVNLVKRLTIVQGAVSLTNAQAAVSKAEASLQQADADTAKSLAIALPSSTERNALLNKLINIQNIISIANAKTVVNRAEGSKQQADLDAAEKLVNTLPSSTSKTDLSNRLTTLQNVINLTDATNAVLKAEVTIVQADIGVAKDLVTKIPTSTSRTDLLNRLTIVQNNINLTIATNAVSKAELTKIQEDVDVAKNLALALITSTEKSNLLNRLVNVQNRVDLTNATDAVVKSKESKRQVDVDRAMNLVNALPSSTTKTNLLNILATVQDAINLTNATKAVVK
ncbi:hypothetical protein Clocel_1307 [Clostridium cellulovorans 743B]|uniref:RCC1-like domain-containing protein n=2 Tax=Clostridium cellulovorans TaxID=1493 RepID=D9SVD7_CLOC7|nr:hypothetical protein Clocel_1307 [Clostridium cellulovorans 743B]